MSTGQRRTAHSNTIFSLTRRSLGSNRQRLPLASSGIYPFLSSRSCVMSTASSDIENNRPNSTGLWNTRAVALMTLSDAHSKRVLLLG